ncbi:FK506-binding protein 15 isoform X2 [Macrosteles quadrilineatus]|uniref:FK506-binding protein 15 isoform X2 n=1 Tax=Macrosteles quadrilineatus TaxID=74068 RepID=UPI0023E13929|nr:FK506-binding protein 15 isoform X2 [Macrosteles quadrilineatus]
MLFSRDKDDDDDFNPNPNYHSNLASIFGNAGSGGENNSSLTYTPPKQPRRQNKPSTIAAPSSSGRSSSLLCAKTVQTFKMVDGAYQNQGKLGAAVLSFGSEEGATYQILLYRDKQNHLCNSRILREFNFHIQPKNYCTFYDKLNTIWSILFDSPADMVEFNLQVAKCRWKAEHSTSPILIQDLWCPVQSGDSPVAAAGDSVDLTFTLSTIDNTTQEVGQPQRIDVQVESSGWKQALIGVQLNTQRVIILQPFMLGDLNPNESVYKSPVVVKFTVLQVTKVPQPEPPPVPPAKEIKHQETETPKLEPSLPEVSEQKVEETPRSPKSTKVDLINRMARMGQALPFKTAVPTPSDSDETEEDRNLPTHRLSKVVPKPRTRQSATVPLAVQGETVPAKPHATVTSQVPLQWATTMQPYSVGNMYPVPQISSPLESHSQFNMFLSEVRTTNSELRMGLTRLTDKVDNLHTKVEESKNAPPSLGIGPVLEQLKDGEKHLKDQLHQVLTILQNTQLVSQNRASAESTAQSAVTPRTSDVEPCLKCVQLQQTNTELSEKVKKLQEENEFLQISLSAQKDALFNAKIADKDQLSQINSLQKQVSEEQRRVLELNNRLASLERVEETLKSDLQTANNTITELQDTIREKQTSIDRLEQALKESEETKLEEVRRNMQEVMDPKPVIEEHIKKISNAVYRMVKVQFEPQVKYDANFIQSVLAETIKAVTLQYLQNSDLTNSEKPIATKIDSVSDISGQTKHEDLNVEEEMRSTSDVESKSEVSTSTQQSSEDSLNNQAQNTTEGKVDTVPGENQSEVKSDSENEKANIVSNSSAKLGPATCVPDTNEESSDDVWRPQPPPPPLFEDEEADDDWLNS